MKINTYLYRNGTIAILRDYIQSIVKKQRNASLVMVFIMTHTVTSTQVLISGELCELKKIIDIIDVPTLHEIPKLMFIQTNENYKSKYLDLENIISAWKNSSSQTLDLSSALKRTSSSPQKTLQLPSVIPANKCVGHSDLTVSMMFQKKDHL
ncbi:hypothetical protein [Trichoplusia ni ascovirus 2c]|uniref:hypothetical protein n=1 Tax=Trichoplusia ni ascovirus 2c TaxID=328615 RepID=UPI0000E441EE|nr:hypothetical protein TNAV2c_gp022 [Trichoplusia ni ascovirus 2c]ABF70539.1 hypothetical protein [Trichoplusia ni ascovirus 2c]